MVSALVGERPGRHRPIGRVDDPTEGIGPRKGSRALRISGGLEQLELAADCVIPLVDGDDRCRAAVAEVADDQEVAVPVDTVEAGAAPIRGAAEGNLVLEEPEPLLRVTAVIETVRAEEEDVAGRGGSTR